MNTRASIRRLDPHRVPMPFKPHFKIGPLHRPALAVVARVHRQGTGSRVLAGMFTLIGRSVRL